LGEESNNERFFGAARRGAEKFGQDQKPSQSEFGNSDSSSVLTENRRRVQRTAPWWFSSDHTRFFEAEITWPALERLTDNDVIEHVDLQNPGSSGQPAGQSDISFARSRSTGYAACGITFSC
jgi:hypothetical protein